MPRIDADVQAWLWPAVATGVRRLGSGFVVVGGVADHVHVLADLPPTVALAEFVQRLKGSSSHLAGRKGADAFRWQEGYAAFGVSHGDLGKVEAYFRQQATHHAHQTVQADWELSAT